MGPIFPKIKGDKEGRSPMAVREKLLSGDQLNNREKKIHKEMGYKPTDGNVWNPLLKYPKNWPCFCGSDVKFKKCCINKIPKGCPANAAGEYQKVVDFANAGGHPRPEIVKHQPEEASSDTPNENL